MRVLLLLLVLAGCAPQTWGNEKPAPSRELTTVVIENDNYWVTQVRWFCNRSFIYAQRGLDGPGPHTKKLSLTNCSQVVFVAVGRGGRRYESYPISVPTGVVLRVNVAASLHLTSFRFSSR